MTSHQDKLIAEYREAERAYEASIKGNRATSAELARVVGALDAIEAINNKRKAIVQRSVEEASFALLAIWRREEEHEATCELGDE